MRMVMAAAPAFGAPGDVGKNRDAVLARVREAREAGARLLALPELCLTGGCGDLMRHQALQDACRQAALRIARETGGMLCVFGLPLCHEGQLYNAAAVARVTFDLQSRGTMDILSMAALTVDDVIRQVHDSIESAIIEEDVLK